MKRKERLRTQADFDRVFGHGISFANRLAVLYVLENGLDHNRAGFVTSRRLGNAVTRNRLKRRYREVVRLLWPEISRGYDLVVLPRGRGKHAEFSEIQQAVCALVREAGLIEGEDDTTCQQSRTNSTSP